MKLNLLNDNLKVKEFKKVIFAFSPVALPISKTGKVVPPSEAEDTHYSTIVYNETDEEYSLFEFDRAVERSLTACKKRVSDFSKLRFLISRNSDNSVRLTVGNRSDEHLPHYKVYKGAASALHSGLFEDYIAKSDYVVNDRYVTP